MWHNLQNMYHRIAAFFKNHLIFLPIAIIIVYTFGPSLKLDFSLEDWSHFETLTNKFGQNFPISKMPFSFYFTQYGTLLFSISFLHKLFGFNAFVYYFANLLFRIIASFSIYYLTAYISRKKIIGIIAGLIFGVSYPGIENTTWATLFWVFPATIALCTFLLFWYKFHENPNIKSLVASVFLFWLTLFIYPVRTFGVPLMVMIGEIYWLCFCIYKGKVKRVEIMHFVILIIIFSLMMALTTSFKTTAELSGKLISPTVFFHGLLNGYPPIFLSIWLFIGNLFLPADFLKILPNVSSPVLFAVLMAIITLPFVYLNIKKRNFNMAILSIIPLTFPFFIFLATPQLKDWQSLWILSAQIGGSIFIWSALLCLLLWKNNRVLSKTSALGILLLLSHLTIPWLVSSQVSDNDQSAFNLISRYYTVPSIGSSIIVGSLLYFLFHQITFLKSNYIKYSLLSLIFMFATVIIASHIYLSNRLLNDRLVFLDRKEHENIWYQLKPLIGSEKKDEVKLVYIKGNLTENEKYMMRSFPSRLAFEEGYYSLSQSPTFIFTDNENYAKNFPTQYNNFFAFKIKEGNIENLKDEVFQKINKN